MWKQWRKYSTLGKSISLDYTSAFNKFRVNENIPTVECVIQAMSDKGVITPISNLKIYTFKKYSDIAIKEAINYLSLKNDIPLALAIDPTHYIFTRRNIIKSTTPNYHMLPPYPISFQETNFNSRFIALLKHIGKVEEYMKNPNFSMNTEEFTKFCQENIFGYDITDKEVPLAYTDYINGYIGKHIITGEIFLVGPPKYLMRKFQSENYTLLDLELCLNSVKKRVIKGESLEDIILEVDSGFQQHFEHCTTASIIMSMAKKTKKDIVLITNKEHAFTLPYIFENNVAISYEELLKIDPQIKSKNSIETRVIKQALLDAIYRTQIWNDDSVKTKFNLQHNEYSRNKQEIDEIFKEAYLKYKTEFKS